MVQKNQSRVTKRALRAIWQENDREALHAAAQAAPSRIVRFLVGRLCSSDEDEKLRAVTQLGELVETPGLLDQEALLEVLRRLLWSLNDESGAIPFGAPEALGEILARRPETREVFLPILCSMLTTDSMSQTGAVERGLYWALGRVGPSVIACCPEILPLMEETERAHPDPDTRRAASLARQRIQGRPPEGD